jgi:hypothetical protein
MLHAICKFVSRGLIGRLLLGLGLALPCLGPVQAQSTGDSLAQYYRQMEQQLLSQGLLRQERRVPGLDAQTLARNFMAIAMRSEYALRGGSATSSGHTAPLRRWETPIRLGVRFGASVDRAQQQRDLATIRSVAQRLQQASGHPMALVNTRANFHVLVLSEAERANIRPVLQQIAPDLSRAAQNAVLRMRRNTFCMVVAIPGPDPAQGLQQAIAIVRAEHPPLMRQSCIEEELAQGMGLSNDSRDARPSIFNDDEEFGVLTRHDELLLRILYSDSLRCGMSAGAVDDHVETLAAAVLRTG